MGLLLSGFDRKPRKSLCVCVRVCVCVSVCDICALSTLSKRAILRLVISVLAIINARVDIARVRALGTNQSLNRWRRVSQSSTFITITHRPSFYANNSSSVTGSLTLQHSRYLSVWSFINSY